MKMQQSGFTLIELVMVIVIIGILAATALPKFANLSNDANTAAAKGFLGSAQSAATIYYAQQAVGGTAAWPTGTQLANAIEGSGTIACSVDGDGDAVVTSTDITNDIDTGAGDCATAITGPSALAIK